MFLFAFDLFIGTLHELGKTIGMYWLVFVDLPG